MTAETTAETSGPAPRRVLRIDASMRTDGSTSRAIADRVEARLAAASPGLGIDRLDLAEAAPSFVNAAWIGANFSPEESRDAAARAALAESEALVARLEAADHILIAMPVYNFGPPAALKAWIDQVARARRTFRYTENGPEGLLTGKRATIVATSGGTALNSEIDFATPWLRHVLGFLGINDVTVISGERQMANPDAVDQALAAADQIAA